MGKYLVILLLLFCLVPTTKAQKVNLDVTRETIRVINQSLDGYGIMMHFTKREIFKEWWKFSKDFSRNETRKGQIRHTIPPKEGESTVPVVFYSEVEAPDSLNAKLKAALNDNGMSSGDIKKYGDQVRQLLIDFKVGYYRDNLQKKILKTEKRARGVGKNLDRYVLEGIKLQKKLNGFEKEDPKSKEDLIEMEYLEQRMALNQSRKDSVNHQLTKINQRLGELRKMAGEIN